MIIKLFNSTKTMFPLNAPSSEKENVRLRRRSLFLGDLLKILNYNNLEVTLYLFTHPGLFLL